MTCLITFALGFLAGLVLVALAAAADPENN